MNTFQLGILTLIKSAITGECAHLPEGFTLDEAEAFISRQQLTTLAYTGFINCGFSASFSPAARRLFKQHCQHLLYSEHQLQACSQVFQAFEAEGIDYLPLKGCVMKDLYPCQELRWMSDADILIRTQQYQRIHSIMTALGFEEVVESDHEYVWHSNELHLELHKRLIPSYNKDYYAYFGDGWERAQIQQGTRYILSPEDTFIFQFVHFAKHYRDGGAGCRYVLDLWVYLRMHPDIDVAYIHRELKKLRLLDFHQNIMRLISVWFENSVSDDQTDFITNFIFNGGSWGSWQNHLLSAELRKASPDQAIRAHRLQKICTMLFPNASSMSYRYPILEKVPVLLPFFWPVRWIRVLLFRRRSLRIKQKELQFVTSERINSYHQALRRVGLDFDFDK